MAITITNKQMHNSGFAARVRDYLILCKYRVVALLALTAVVGQVLAPENDRLLIYQVLSILGIALLASSAAVINHLVDSDIDNKMKRTQNRPVVKGRVSTNDALIFSFFLAVIGITLLVAFANWLAAILTFAALVGYAFIYTLLLKRATPQNIVIGGVAGAMPPLLGWVAETGSMSAEPWLLVMIIFTWTPPHFWALAIDRKNDYSKANIPMLPVTHGVEFTKTMILLYSVLLFVIGLFPYIINMAGGFYLLTSCLLNGWLIMMAIKLKWREESTTAIGTFKYSIWQLMLLFVVLLVDKWMI